MEIPLWHNGTSVAAIAAQPAWTYWVATIIWWRKKASTVMDDGSSVLRQWWWGYSYSAGKVTNSSKFCICCRPIKWFIEEAFNLLFQHTNVKDLLAETCPSGGGNGSEWKDAAVASSGNGYTYVEIVRRSCHNHNKTILWTSSKILKLY